MSNCSSRGGPLCGSRLKQSPAPATATRKLWWRRASSPSSRWAPTKSRERSRRRKKPMAETYDLIVLGSGPGGYVAAIRAAQLGLKTAIVEREMLGGICLNWGCIPTKALLRSAEIFHQIKHAESYGLSAGQAGFDLAKVVARSRAVAGQLNKGVTGLMKKNKIAVSFGDGKFI